MTTPGMPDLSAYAPQDPGAQAEVTPSGSQQQEVAPAYVPQEQAPAQVQSDEGMYQQYLAQIPEVVRPSVEGVFKEWDAGVTKRIQQVHSEYEPYKQYIEEWDPEAIGKSLELLIQIERDPKAFYDALGAAFNFGGTEQGPGLQQQPPYQQQQPPAYVPGTVDPTTGQPLQQVQQPQEDPRIAELMQQQAVITQALMAQQEQAALAQATAELETRMANLHAQHDREVNGVRVPGFDDAMIYRLVSTGIEPEDAVAQYVASFAAIAGPPAPVQAPVVMGGAGGVPSMQRDVKTMSDKDTESLVAQYLAQAASQT